MPGMPSLVMTFVVATLTARLSTTYWGDDGCRSNLSTTERRIRSGPASFDAALPSRLICGGSAVTSSVCTVIASTVPSLVVIAPRTAGISAVVVFSCSASVRSLPESTPCSCISRPTISVIANATDSSVAFSRRSELVRRSGRLRGAGRDPGRVPAAGPGRGGDAGRPAGPRRGEDPGRPAGAGRRVDSGRGPPRSGGGTAGRGPVLVAKWGGRGGWSEPGGRGGLGG